MNKFILTLMVGASVLSMDAYAMKRNGTTGTNGAGDDGVRNATRVVKRTSGDGAEAEDAEKRAYLDAHNVIKRSWREVVNPAFLDGGTKEQLEACHRIFDAGQMGRMANALKSNDFATHVVPALLSIDADRIEPRVKQFIDIAFPPKSNRSPSKRRSRSSRNNGSQHTQAPNFHEIFNAVQWSGARAPLIAAYFKAPEDDVSKRLTHLRRLPPQITDYATIVTQLLGETEDVIETILGNVGNVKLFLKLTKEGVTAFLQSLESVAATTTAAATTATTTTTTATATTTTTTTGVPSTGSSDSGDDGGGSSSRSSNSETRDPNDLSAGGDTSSASSGGGKLTQGGMYTALFNLTASGAEGTDTATTANRSAAHKSDSDSGGGALDPEDSSDAEGSSSGQKLVKKPQRRNTPQRAWDKRGRELLLQQLKATYPHGVTQPRVTPEPGNDAMATTAASSQHAHSGLVEWHGSTSHTPTARPRRLSQGAPQEEAHRAPLTPLDPTPSIASHTDVGSAGASAATGGASVATHTSPQLATQGISVVSNGGSAPTSADLRSEADADETPQSSSAAATTTPASGGAPSANGSDSYELSSSSSSTSFSGSGGAYVAYLEHLAADSNDGGSDNAPAAATPASDGTSVRPLPQPVASVAETAPVPAVTGGADADNEGDEDGDSIATATASGEADVATSLTHVLPLDHTHYIRIFGLAPEGSDEGEWARNHYDREGHAALAAGTLDPAHFNVNAYFDLFIDLRNIAGSPESGRAWLIQHYLQNGHGEIERGVRHPDESAFDHEDYLSFYTDLGGVTASLSPAARKKWAIHHYLEHGYNEIASRARKNYKG